MTSDIATDHITDDYMRARIHGARKYSLVVLRPTPALFEQSSAPIIWEHGRRNMALQAAGTMPIVCPVGDDAISGIAIFDVAADEARRIMSDDPGVRAGIFVFDVHECRGFPGDALPN